MRKILLLSLFMIGAIFTANISMAQEQLDGKANYSFGGHVFTGDFPITMVLYFFTNIKVLNL